MFVDSLEDRCETLGEMPVAYPLLKGASGVRRRAFRGYLILYRIHGGDVQILRIVQGSRDLAGIALFDPDADS